MQQITVKDLMVPLGEYATVREDASLYEAVKALENAQKNFKCGTHLYPHRAILIYGKNNKIIGKISQLDVLKALEPKYGDVDDLGTISSAGLSVEFIRSIMNRYDLYQGSFVKLCIAASKTKVKDVMYTPKSDEFVGENDTLGNAIHHLIMGHHQSLLVTKGSDIVGILRLTDIFNKAVQNMESEKG